MRYVPKLLKRSAIVAAIALAGCASDYPYQYTAAGATIGGVSGAVIGHQLNHKNGRYVGGALGALLGGAIGLNADQVNQGAYRRPYSSSSYPAADGYTQSYPYRSQDYDYDRNSGYAPYPPYR
ncbi:MAG: glycine zipper 2TM domain-containing protein [Gammaproteobacteria bacterium]